LPGRFGPFGARAFAGALDALASVSVRIWSLLCVLSVVGCDDRAAPRTMPEFAETSVELTKIRPRASIDPDSAGPSCLGALNDWDFNAHLAYRSPCYTDGGAPPQ
jgi:hypothetical protein